MGTAITFVKNIIFIISFILSFTKIPFYSAGNQIDLGKFELTFEDQFDTLDRNVWSGHYTYDNKTSVRKGGYWNLKMPYTEDGKLIIPVKYLKDGLDGAKAGWYSCGIDTDSDAPNGFSQKYGYFEIRCILPECASSYAAFWLFCDGVYNADGSGEDGSEIDIMESLAYQYEYLKNGYTTDIHYDGYGSMHQHQKSKTILINGNPYKEFNTYGVEWNENGYKFYVNGKYAYTSTVGGVSKVPEYMIISMQTQGNNGVPSYNIDESEEYQYIIDYVRVYQYKDLL